MRLTVIYKLIARAMAFNLLIFHIDCMRNSVCGNSLVDVPHEKASQRYFMV